MSFDWTKGIDEETMEKALAFISKPLGTVTGKIVGATSKIMEGTKAPYLRVDLAFKVVDVEDDPDSLPDDNQQRKEELTGKVFKTVNMYFSDPAPFIRLVNMIAGGTVKKFDPIKEINKFLGSALKMTNYKKDASKYLETKYIAKVKKLSGKLTKGEQVELEISEKKKESYSNNNSTSSGSEEGFSGFEDSSEEAFSDQF